MDVFRLCGRRPQDIASRDQAVALAYFSGRIRLLSTMITSRLVGLESEAQAQVRARHALTALGP